jgi:hypothetical protein
MAMSLPKIAAHLRSRVVSTGPGVSLFRTDDFAALCDAADGGLRMYTDDELTELARELRKEVVRRLEAQSI